MGYLNRHDNPEHFCDDSRPMQQKPEPSTKDLKEAMYEANRAAEKAAHAYATACEIGPERVRAFEIYERIRTSVAVPL